MGTLRNNFYHRLHLNAQETTHARENSQNSIEKHTE